MIGGTIVKGIAGFYYVKTENGVYECKARGIFRKNNVTPLVGDRVEISIQEEKAIEKQAYIQGTIEKILPRKNELIRPPVANVDQGIVVFSVTYPQIHLDLLDRFLIMVERENIKPYIVLNKVEDADEKNYDYIIEGYKKSGYEVLCVSAKSGYQLERLSAQLKDQTSFFAGPSGVGKSTLLNAMEKSFRLETGSVSEKIKRGKHTTRHVELLPLEQGGFVLDTPGFTSLQLESIKEEELRHYYPEFAPYEGHCKFNGCVHIHEPGCAVKQALQEGKLFNQRYDNYVTYYTELKNLRRW
jgi:ribosome biogenesis GTPase